MCDDRRGADSAVKSAYLFAAFCLTTLLRSAAIAQDEAPADAATEAVNPEYSLDEIVVTGTKTRHRVDDSPIQTQVIGKEEIARTSATTIEEVLDQVADIYVRRNDQFRLGASTVRMQGADPNKVAILLNGRRFRGGVDGVVDLRDIPAQNIERIEIIRGPASNLYGSDAMAGVINIITRAGTEKPSIKGTVGAGNFGRFLASASHGYHIGDLSYFLSAQHDEIEIAQLFGEISGQYAGAASDAKQTRDNVFLTLDYRPFTAHRFSLTGDYTPVREGPKSTKHNLTTTLGWDWQPTPLTDFFLNASRYGFERDNQLQGFEEDVSYEDWSGEARLAYSLLNGVWIESHLLSLGHRIRAEALDAAGLAFTSGSVTIDPGDVHASATLNSTYVQDEITLGESWTAVAGASVDVHQYFGAQVNPRLSVTWRPNDRYRASATVGRGFRAPDLLQLFDVDPNNITLGRDLIRGYIILGNRDLQPETDLGVSLHFEARPLDGLNATLGLFRHDFRDLIGVALACAGPTTCSAGYTNPFPQLSGQIFRYQNIGSALTQGFDIGLGIDPATILQWRTSHRVGLQLNYAFLHSRNTSDRPGESGKELPFRPPHRFLPAITYRNTTHGLDAKLWGEYEDRTYTDITNSPDFIARSHWLWNTRIAARPAQLLGASRLPTWLREGYDWMSFFVEATNLTDEEFGLLTPMGRVAGRRTFLAGVQYER